MEHNCLEISAGMPKKKHEKIFVNALWTHPGVTGKQSGDSPVWNINI